MRIFYCQNKEKKAKERLYLFFNGWGMDETPFLQLLSVDEDWLIISDFTPQGMEKIVHHIKNYNKVVLISWSMGVWVGQYFFTLHQPLKDRLEYCLAINGTLNPIDDKYGIPPILFESMADNFSVESRDRFYRQMCGRDLHRFMDNRPKRQLGSQLDELKRFLSAVKPLELDISIYNKILISSKDFIVPTKNQKQFWKNSETVIVKGSHFPFYSWKSLADCIDQCRVSDCQ